MTINLKLKSLIAVALLSGFSSFATASAEESADRNNSLAPEVTTAEVKLLYLDMPFLKKAYIDSSPADKKDGIVVGELGVDGGNKDKIVKLAQEIADSKHGKYDSLLIAHKGKVKAQEPEVVELGTRYTFQSSILGEDREILVRLPEGYEESDKRYPVVYLTDGGSHFSYTTLMASVLEEQERMPHSIFVGIVNAETRGRDLLTHKDNFRRYIKEEIFPFINSNFRTSDIRTLYGGSMGGVFVLEILADHRDMFANYITASAGPRDELIKKFENLFAAKAEFDKTVYFTMTEKGEEGAGGFNGANNLAALFEEKAPKDLKWRYDFIGGEVHMTTPIPTLYTGLSHAFRDYQAPTFNSNEEFEKAGGMQALEALFSNRANKYGSDPEVPEHVRNRLGWLYFDENEREKAFAILEENVRLHPENMGAYESLGSIYYYGDRPADALEIFKKAKALAEAQGAPNMVEFFERGIQYSKDKLAK